MFSNQKGFLVISTFMIGFCLAVLGIVLLPYSLNSIFPEGFPKAFDFGSLYKLILLFLFSFVPILFGVIITGLLPSIRILRTGIKVKRLVWVQMFNWSEIEEIVDLERPSGAKGLIISTKGPVLVKFIKNYPFFLYGVFTGVFEPVVILSGGLENRDEIISEIEKHINGSQ